MGDRDFVDKETVNVYHVKMPMSVSASVVIDEDGEYTIYINSELSKEKQVKAFEHELKHIKRNDLYYCDDVQTIEDDIRS